MDKLKYIRLENPDGSYSESIPISVDSNTIDIDGEPLTEVLEKKANKTAVNTLTNDLEVQKERIDSIIALPDGATTGDAELADARIDYKGGVADTLGDGLRESFKEIEEDFPIGKNKYNPAKKIEHALVNDWNGVIQISEEEGTVIYGYNTTEYIKIKTGDTITLNTPRKICIYDNNKNFVSGVDWNYNATSTGTKTPYTFTSEVNGYMIASFRNFWDDTFQIEEGSTVTTYEPYYKEYIYLNKQPGENSPQVLKANLQEYSDTNTKYSISCSDVNQITYFKDSGKNMLNKNNVKSNWFLGTGSGLTMYDDGGVLNGYYTTYPIKIQPGTTYTLRCRMWRTYDKTGVKKRNDNLGSNYSLCTFTPKSDEYFLAISDATSHLYHARCEKGDTETEYEDFIVKIPGLDVSESIPPFPTYNWKNLFKVTKNQYEYVLSKQLNNTQTLSITTDRYGSGNGGFNFRNTKINDTIFHSTGDDITPLRTTQTVGANHLYTCWVQNSIGDLTTVDLGSIWTDGNHNFCLIDIQSNQPYFMADYTVDDGIVSANVRTPVGNLTHVSGATHTTTITKNGSSKQNAIISEKIRHVDYYINDMKIETDGDYYTDNLKIIEKYNILSYKGIYDWATAHIGQNYKDNLSSIPICIEQSNIFAFDKELTCIVTSNITVVEKVHVDDCGFLQSAGISSATRYMFGINSISDQDFTQGVPVSDITTTRYITKTYWKNEDFPPIYYIDYDSNKELAFTMGYLPEFNQAKPSIRKNNINNRAWDFRDTKKSYPVAISQKILLPGDSLTFKGFRKYITDVSNFTIKLKDIEYYFINGVIANAHTMISNYTTKGEILASDRFVMKDLDSMTYSVEKGGYAIIKKVNE